MEKNAIVTIREAGKKKKVKITSDSKPDIIDSTILKWQALFDTLAKIINVPSGLIMRLNSDNIEVFLKSNTGDNPYEVHEKAELKYGLYCETVIGTQKPLIISDATKSKIWGKNNPDVDINMVSYLGVPIYWPDGECFGTVCVLDNKENHYSNDFINLINQFKQHIELDLQLLLTNIELKGLNEVKTKFLSLISHDLRGNISSADALLKILIENYTNYSQPELFETLNGLSRNLSSSRMTLDNLLSWSKSVITNIAPEKVQFNLIDTIQELLEYFSLSIKIKKLEVERNYYSSNATVYADENMLTMSIRNILSNAVKYTEPHGTITINISKSGKKHLLEITDTGIGMDEDTLKNLFNYYEAHQKRGTVGESSAGIGLMLSKEFLDKNDATVQVDSKIDNGTKFSILL